MTTQRSTPTEGTAPENLSIDRAAAERYLAHLDPNAEIWTFQTFDDDRRRRSRSLARVLHGTFAEHLEVLTALNRRGAGVFVTVNATNGGGRSRAHIVRIRAVWQEDDGAGRPVPLEPHLVVETSPGKYHRYFRVEGLAPEEHQSAQQGLVRRYGSDPSATDVARVLRVPGFFHRKGRPFRVQLMQASERPPHARDELLSVLALDPLPAQADQVAPPRPGASDNTIPEGHRNSTLTSLAGTMRRRGMSEAAIAAALAAENGARCRPPLDAAEVCRIARSAARYAPALETVPAVAAAPGAPDRTDAKGRPPRRSTTDAIIALVRERATLFHDAERRVYATFDVDGHRETWPLDGRAFHHWVSAAHYAAAGTVPRESALRDALQALAGIGLYRGEAHKVWLRVAHESERYVIDLGDPTWAAVEVSAAGWRMLEEPPVRFRRTPAMRALPMPRPGGSLDGLWPFLNVPDEDRPLVLAWILECWRPETHTPLLEIGGEQGSGKSDTQARLRDLIDPNEINLRAAPGRVEDLFISAHNNWLVSLNNLSHLPRAQQDALCTLSTGGGFATRTLYSNADETVFDALRPVAMNGIAALATAQDLIDRVVRIELPMLGTRRRSTELAREFEAARPGVFAALLELFVATLRELPEVRLADPPRMADFAHLGEAMFRALGRSDPFLDRYLARQQATALAALEASPVAGAVLALMARTRRWSGPTKALLEVLGRHRQDAEAWPRSPRGLSDALRRCMPALRLLEIHVRFEPIRRRDGYHITLRNAGGGEDTGEDDG